MARKRIYLMIILGLSFVIFCGSAVNGIYAMTLVGVTNYFETGIVDIRITEHQIEQSLEKKWENNPVVLPGDEISKIPRIHNDGNDCYIRARIEIVGKNGTQNEELEKVGIHGISEQWMLAKDGYYYYKEILRTGQSVDFFQSVSISEELSEIMMGETFYIDINVDAIQAKNFEPQFQLEKPWGNVDIVKCKKEGMYDVSSFKQADNQYFQIVYQGESEKLITNSDDFFHNFSYMMPGDLYHETVTMKNDSNDEIKLYFRSEALQNLELLEKIKFKIITDINGNSECFYEGNLKAEGLSKDIVLGIVPKKEEGKFEFQIEIPKELNNEYSLVEGSVKWIFSTEPIQDTSVLEPEQAGQTGDFANVRIVFSILGILISMFMAFGAMMELRKKERDRQDEV